MDLFSQIENPEREELLALRRELEEANHQYYVLNAPTMSDYDFDQKLRRLQDLEALHPDLFDPNSPTQHVGSDLREVKGERLRAPQNAVGIFGEPAKVKGERVPHLAIWCSAILFSAIHMQFYGFVPRMLMGALFGYMLAWTGSLWVPILMHMTNNAVAVILYFVALRADWDMEKVDAIGTNDTLWLGVVSMVITIVGIYIFRRSTTMSSASSRISSGN